MDTTFVKALGSGGICCMLPLKKALFSAKMARKLIMSMVLEPASTHVSSRAPPEVTSNPVLNPASCL